MKTQKNLCNLPETGIFHPSPGFFLPHHNATSPWLYSSSYSNRDQTTNAHHKGYSYTEYRPWVWISWPVRSIIFWSPYVWVKILVLHLLVVWPWASYFMILCPVASPVNGDNNSTYFRGFVWGLNELIRVKNTKPLKVLSKGSVCIIL